MSSQKPANKPTIESAGVDSLLRVEADTGLPDFDTAIDILILKLVAAVRAHGSSEKDIDTLERMLLIDNGSRQAAESVLEHLGDPKGENLAKRIKLDTADHAIPDSIVAKVQIAALAQYVPNYPLNRRAFFGTFIHLMEGAPPTEFLHSVFDKIDRVNTHLFFERCLGLFLNPLATREAKGAWHHYIKVVVKYLPATAFADPLMAKLWVVANLGVDGVPIPEYLALNQSQVFSLQSALRNAAGGYSYGARS